MQRRSCNLTVPFPVLVPLLVPPFYSVPESQARSGFARRSPDHFSPASPKRCTSTGLHDKPNLEHYWCWQCSSLRTLRPEPSPPGLLFLTRALQQSLLLSSDANDILNRLHLVWFERISDTVEPSPGSSIRLRFEGPALLFRIHSESSALTRFVLSGLAQGFRDLFVSSNAALRGLSFTASRRQSQELFFGSWIPSSIWLNFITAVCP
jgi:hypothetical protein